MRVLRYEVIIETSLLPLFSIKYTIIVLNISPALYTYTVQRKRIHFQVCKAYKLLWLVSQERINIHSYF